MKNFKLILIMSGVMSALLGLVIAPSVSHASLSLDGTRLQTSLKCNTPGLVDSGFQVFLREGGSTYRQEAQVLEVTRRGASEVGTYVIAIRKLEGHNVYIDSATEGRDFSLSLYSPTPSGSSTIRAHLNADTRAGRISQALVCEPVYHTLNNDID